MTALEMNWTLWTYAIYVPVSVGMTVWVARTLHSSGRIFLIEAFRGREDLADSVNKLLVVGFYLVNIGFVSLFLRAGTKPESAQGMVESLSTRIGVVLLVLGAMHFTNLFIFRTMHRSSTFRWDEPPVEPTVCAPGGA